MSAPRALWKGFLKFGAVQCGVKLIGAVTESEKIHFNTLNRKTKSPVKSAYIDEETGDVVETVDQQKGYKLDSNEYLLIDPEEIKRLRPESEKTIAIQDFVDRDEIDSRYFDKPYYLVPADKVAEEPYAVIRDALEIRKVAARATVVLFQRDRNVLIESHGKGLIMTTLIPESRLVDEDTVFDGIGVPKIDKEMAEIAGMIIERKMTEFEPEEFTDTYEGALAAMIDAKMKGKKPPEAAPPPKKTNVVSLADVLRKSLEKEGGKAPAGGPKRRKS